MAVIKARTADLREQLATIDADNLARAPHIGVEGGNEAWETCADWRAEEYNTTRCENDCKYEGCHIPGWTVESFCDEGTGICYHGELDELCYGIPDGERYPGMQDGDDGKATFCRLAKGVAAKTSQCPAMGEIIAAPTAVESSAGSIASPCLTMVMLALSTAAAVMQIV